MNVELAVVGAGPAGLSAAIEAAKEGAEVLVIDENLTAGGQLFKQIHKFFGSEAQLAGVRGIDIGRGLLEEMRTHGVKLWLDSVCVGLSGDRELEVVRNGFSQTVKAKEIVLATGAAELPVVFPNWTLPGVVGAGAAQTMVNIYRVLPGSTVLMVGSGNVGLIVAYQLLQAGVRVLAVVEAADRVGGYGVHASKIARAGIPILTSTSIKCAHGDREVEAATIVKVDQSWNAIPGTEQTLKVDTICVAAGLRSLGELAWMANCKFSYVPELGGYVPAHNEWMESTLEGVYVAGDLAGVEEASTAMEEGRLGGISVARDLGYLSEDAALEQKQIVTRSLEALRAGSFGEERREAKKRLTGKWKKSKTPRERRRTGKATMDVVGYPSLKELMESPGFVSSDRLRKGAVAVIECVQDIPCNPCEKACPEGAIKVGTVITNLPALDEEKCTGCGLCIPACPGLCIFLVDMTFSSREALIGFPYEFMPLPTPGDRVGALDRSGRCVCQATVVRVRNPSRYDRTPIVHIVVPREHAQEVRFIARE